MQFLFSWGPWIRDSRVCLSCQLYSCFCSLLNPSKSTPGRLPSPPLHKALLIVFHILHPSVWSTGFLMHILTCFIDVTGTLAILTSIIFHVPPPSPSAASASFSGHSFLSHTYKSWSNLGPFPFFLTHTLLTHLSLWQSRPCYNWYCNYILYFELILDFVFFDNFLKQNFVHMSTTFFTLMTDPTI